MSFNEIDGRIRWKEPRFHVFNVGVELLTLQKYPEGPDSLLIFWNLCQYTRVPPPPTGFEPWC